MSFVRVLLAMMYVAHGEPRSSVSGSQHDGLVRYGAPRAPPTPPFIHMNSRSRLEEVAARAAQVRKAGLDRGSGAPRDATTLQMWDWRVKPASLSGARRCWEATSMRGEQKALALRAIAVYSGSPVVVRYVKRRGSGC